MRGRGGNASREKGKRGERRTIRWLRETMGLEARRGWQARKGSDAPDVEVEARPQWWIEVKAGKKLGLARAFEQAEVAAALSAEEFLQRWPIVVAWPDGRGGPIVVIDGAMFVDCVTR